MLADKNEYLRREAARKEAEMKAELKRAAEAQNRANNAAMNDAIRKAWGLVARGGAGEQPEAQPKPAINPPGHAGAGTATPPQPPPLDMNFLIRYLAGRGR
jgi:hypothetical protein